MNLPYYLLSPHSGYVPFLSFSFVLAFIYSLLQESMLRPFLCCCIFYPNGHLLGTVVVWFVECPVARERRVTLDPSINGNKFFRTGCINRLLVQLLAWNGGIVFVWRYPWSGRRLRTWKLDLWMFASMRSKKSGIEICDWDCACLWESQYFWREFSTCYAIYTITYNLKIFDLLGLLESMTHLVPPTM